MGPSHEYGVVVMPKEIFDRLQKKRVRVDPDLLDMLEEGRTASRSAAPLRMPPKPGIQTYVSETSALGLPTWTDDYKDPSTLPGSATPGGAGREIPQFSYNGPDSDSDITPRTLGIPGEEWGHPVNDTYNTVTRRVVESYLREQEEGGEDEEGMSKEAYRRRWQRGKRQKRQTPAQRNKAKRNRRKNRQKNRMNSKRWRRKNRNNSAYKRSEKRRRKQNRTRRRASVLRVAHAYRTASVLTVPDIAFAIGPEMLLGYVHSISPMSGMVTIELDENNVSQLDSLPVELFMRMAVFLSDADIEAFYDLVDVEIGEGAYEDLDEDMVRECAKRYDRTPDSDEFKSDCFDMIGEEDLAQMDAAQLEKVTQGIMSDFTEGGHARSMEDADNPDIEGEFDPHLFYGEVNLG